MRSISFVTLLLFAAAANQVFADMAPPPGFSAVGNALELRISDTLTGYRFFLLDAGGTVEEIVFDSSGRMTIDSSGRGGASRFATLWAVPVASVPEGELSEDDLKVLADDLASGTVEGHVKLLRHEFRKEVSVIGSGGEHRDVYEIARDPATGKPVADPKAEESGPQSGIPYLLVAFAVGGLLIFAAVVLAGVLLFRRSRRSRVK